MAATQEDSFREIQLSGKALVFVFMAGTVILVGVFLMGLLVGRGVLATKGAPGVDTVAASEAEPPLPPAPATSASSAAPSTAGEKLSYAERLGSAEPAKEQLKPDAPAALPANPPTPKAESITPAAAAPPPARPVPAPAAAPPARPAATAAVPAAKSAEAPGGEFAIQVAALREQQEADVIVKRLAAKGYPAYVVAPAKGAPPVFRVRVGKYKDRSEADTVAARLQKEEQFKPWIVR